MRRAAHRQRLDQFQRPLLSDRAGVRNLRGRGRVHLSGSGRLSRLGSARPALVCAWRNAGLSTDPVRRADLRLGQARPRMGKEGSRISKLVSPQGELPDAIAEYTTGLCTDYQDRRANQLDAQIQSLVHALWPGLLCDRIDAYGWTALRYRALRRHAARLRPPIRSNDH